MDLEAPADAWYVWLAVTLVSLAIGGIVLGLPTGPPPDATQAANTVERTAGSTIDTSGRYEHDADEVNIDGTTIALRNEHGTTRASSSYGRLVPVMGNDDLERIARGDSLEDVYGTSDADGQFLADLAAANERVAGEWQTADGELAVRTLTLEAETGPSVSLLGTQAAADWESDDDRGLTEATIQYTASAETDLSIELSMPKFIRGEETTKTASLPTDGTQSEHELEFVSRDDPDIESAVDYKISAEVYTDGTLECDAFLNSPGRFGTICDGGALAGETGDAVEQIAEYRGNGEYRVTVVTA